jgi:hypothetical protein
MKLYESSSTSTQKKSRGNTRARDTSITPTRRLDEDEAARPHWDDCEKTQDSIESVEFVHPRLLRFRIKKKRIVTIGSIFFINARERWRWEEGGRNRIDIEIDSIVDCQ